MTGAPEGSRLAAVSGFELPSLSPMCPAGGPLRGCRPRDDPNLGQDACQALEDAVALGSVIAVGEGLDTYDRHRRPRTQMVARRSHQIGTVGQWASPAAVRLRDSALRLLPSSSVTRSPAPILDWTA